MYRSHWSVAYAQKQSETQNQCASLSNPLISVPNENFERWKQFEFDLVDDHAEASSIFEQCILPLVARVCCGENASVVLYGSAESPKFSLVEGGADGEGKKIKCINKIK